MRRLIVLVALFLIACAHTHTKPVVTAAQERKILAELTQQTSAREKLSGFGAISLSGLSRSGTAHGVLQLQWPQKFRLEFQDPLGGRQFLLQFDEHYLLLDDPHSEAVRLVDITHEDGLRAARALGGLASVGLANFHDWLQVFLARPSLEGFTVDPEDPQHLRKWKGGRLVEEIRLDGRNDDLAEWRLNQGAGKDDDEIHIYYEDYERRAALEVPRTLRIEVEKGHNKGGKLVWHWQDWQPSEGRASVLIIRPEELARERKILREP